MFRKTIIHRIVLVVALALASVAPASPVYAGTNVWTSIGPGSGVIYALAIDPATPATLYAVTNGGVYKSTNGGGRWSPTSSDLTNIAVVALAIDPATPAILYAGTSNGSRYPVGDVYKSTKLGVCPSPHRQAMTRRAGRRSPAMSIRLAGDITAQAGRLG